jgi:hypothetical protein
MRNSTRLCIRLYLAITAMLFSCTGPARRGLPADCAAVVWGNCISRAEVDQEVRRYFNQIRRLDSLRSFTRADTLDQRRQKLRGIAEQRALLKIARDRGIALEPGQVEERLGIILSGLYVDDTAKFHAVLQEDGQTRESFQQELELVLLAENYRKTWEPELKIDSNDVAKYYRQHQAEFLDTQMEASHILVMATDIDNQERALSSVTTIVNKKDPGLAGPALENAVRAYWSNRKALVDSLHGLPAVADSFAELAKKFSDDPSSKDGGTLGPIKKGQTSGNFDQAAFSLKQGEISPVVQTEFGYHIIKCTAPTRVQLQPLENVYWQIENMLKGKKEARLMEKLMKQAKYKIFWDYK